MNVKNVLEWLESAANSYPDKVVYQDEINGISFRELKHKARVIGTSMVDVENYSPIAVFASRSILTAVSFLGVVYSGHAYAPIDPSLPEKRIDSILDILTPTAVVIDSANKERILPIITRHGIDKFFIVEDILDADHLDDKCLSVIRGKMISTDPLYVIFTSGSSGKPKGVITSHVSLITYIESYVKVMNINKDDVLGNQSPLDYIAAIRDIYIPLLTCCKSMIIPKNLFMQPKALFDFVNQNGITTVGWSVSVFTLLSKLGCFDENNIRTLRKICFSGSVMPPKCLKEWQTNLPEARFVNQYGPTEATASCTYYVIDHVVDEDENISIGIPYDNYRVYLMDENMNEVSDGSVGQICVTGPILALGYYNDRERTEESFVFKDLSVGYPVRIYKTGDLGRIREDGLLEFHGRLDRQIKHMGHRVELSEIELACNSISGVIENVVVYDKAKEQLVMFYVGNAEKKDIITELRKSLPDFMIPRRIIKTESIYKLPNGKVDIKEMEERLK